MASAVRTRAGAAEAPASGQVRVDLCYCIERQVHLCILTFVFDSVQTNEKQTQIQTP